MTGQNQKARRGLGEIQSIVFIHTPQHTLRKKSEGAKTGFGGKSSWFNPVFGNHLIDLCQKKG